MTDIQPEPLTITDSAGEVRTQRPISLSDTPPKRRGRPPKKSKRIRVYNKINAKIFLSDGRHLDPCSEGDVTEEDLQIKTVKDRVVVLA